MKTRNPKNRADLKIKRNDYVLEVGGGHNPHRRSNVVVDKYADSNYHRSGDLIVRNNQKFMEADGENLPFDKNTFDYVICNQVLEHVENPERFLKEQFRVAKQGFIETPSLIGEYLFPKKSHKWVILELENKLVLYPKEKMNFNSVVDFGDMFLDYLPTHSIAYKLLQRTYPNLITVRYEWKNEIEFIVDPKSPELVKYFTENWTQEMYHQFFNSRSKLADVKEMLWAVGNLISTFSRTIINRKFGLSGNLSNTIKYKGV